MKQLLSSCDVLLTDQEFTSQFAPLLSKSLRWIHTTTAGVNLLMENPSFAVGFIFLSALFMKQKVPYSYSDFFLQTTDLTLTGPQNF